MTLNLLQALCVRENVVRLRFDVALYFSNVLDPGDASEIARYKLQPLLSTIGSDGLPPRDVWPARAQLYSPTEIDLWVDRRFSPFPARYSVAVNGLFIENLTEGLGSASAEFFAVRAGKPTSLPEDLISNADLSNPQSLSTIPEGLPATDELLGTYPVDDTGDLARDIGLASYKKRVLRRLSSKKGKYAHLGANYGVAFPQSVKTLARAGVLAALAADAMAQIREEPETVDASVRVVQQGGVFFFKIRVRCSFAQQPVDLLTPVQFTG